MNTPHVRRIRDVFALAVLALLTLTPVFGQFDSASVLGTVRDSSGAAVPAAKVTLENIKTGIQQNTNTDNAGNFQILNVPIGSYRLSGEAQGFKKAVAGEFTVTVNARQRVDLTLQVGDVAEQIIVTDAATPLETDTSSRGTVVSTNQIVNLPLNGRSYADLALLAPGVRKSSIATSRDASFNVNGMRSSLNNFVVDGVDNNAYGTSNQGFSNQVVQLSPDAVQEFRIETTNYSAEFGRAGGGVINASIRSGTNAFHGSVLGIPPQHQAERDRLFQACKQPEACADSESVRRCLRRSGHQEQSVLLRRLRRLPPHPEEAGIFNPADAGPAAREFWACRSAIRYTGEVYSDGVIPQAQITPFRARSARRSARAEPAGPGE